MDRLVLETLARDIGSLTLQHIWIVFVAAASATVLGVALGIAGTRNPAVRRYSIGFANVTQTIPSLAMFGFLIPIPLIGGIGPRVAILSLILYALLPILRNTITGILSVDPAVRESAMAMGMTDGQLLRYVELPLAAPTILAGIRTATVATIGTATIAAAIGASSAARAVSACSSFGAWRLWTRYRSWLGRFQRHCWRCWPTVEWRLWSGTSR